MDAQRPLTVVVVEDEADLRELLVYALEVAKFTVLEAASVADAREVLGGDAKPDVLVADYTLPDGTGADLLTVGAAGRPRVCILLSGHDARDIGTHAFDVVLTKPVTPERLVREIRTRFSEE